MKKGQAALEFLTTYGWAFLVVLVMIGALAYFGVLNPSRLLPDKCVFGAGIGGCTDWGVSVDKRSVEAVVINNYGKTFTQANFTFSVIGTSCPAANLRINISSGSWLNNSDSLASSLTNTWDADAPLTVRLYCNAVAAGFASGERPKVSYEFKGIQSGSAYVTPNSGIVSVRIP